MWEGSPCHASWSLRGLQHIILYWPIRDQYSGHVTRVDQWQISIWVRSPVMTSIEVMWSVLISGQYLHTCPPQARPLLLAESWSLKCAGSLELEATPGLASVASCLSWRPGPGPWCLQCSPGLAASGGLPSSAPACGEPTGSADSPEISKCIDQSETSIQVTWSVLTNERTDLPRGNMRNSPGRWFFWTASVLWSPPRGWVRTRRIYSEAPAPPVEPRMLSRISITSSLAIMLNMKRDFLLKR